MRVKSCEPCERANYEYYVSMAISTYPGRARGGAAAAHAATCLQPGAAGGRRWASAVVPLPEPQVVAARALPARVPRDMHDRCHTLLLSTAERITHININYSIDQQ